MLPNGNGGGQVTEAREIFFEERFDPLPQFRCTPGPHPHTMREGTARS